MQKAETTFLSFTTDVWKLRRFKQKFKSKYPEEPEPKNLFCQAASNEWWDLHEYTVFYYRWSNFGYFTWDIYDDSWDIVA